MLVNLRIAEDMNISGYYRVEGIPESAMTICLDHLYNADNPAEPLEHADVTRVLLDKEAEYIQDIITNYKQSSEFFEAIESSTSVASLKADLDDAREKYNCLLDELDEYKNKPKVNIVELLEQGLTVDEIVRLKNECLL